MTTRAMYLMAKNISVNIAMLANTSATIIVFQVPRFSPMNSGPTCTPCSVNAPISTATAQELFNACRAQGGAGWDHSAMVRALEHLANFEVA